MLGDAGGDVGVGDGAGVGELVGGGGGGGVTTVIIPEEFTFWFTVMAAKVVAARVMAIMVSASIAIFASLEDSTVFPSFC